MKLSITKSFLQSSHLFFRFITISLFSTFITASAFSQSLQTSASSSQSNVLAGTNITYDFFVLNTTGASTTNTSLTITLPAGLSHVANNSSCTASATSVVCPLGTIANTSSAQARVTFHVKDSYVSTTGGAGFVNFSATATSTENPSANTFVGNTPVLEESDLQITNVTTDRNPRAGEVFTYTIYVDNWAPSSARDVVINDTLLNSESVSIQSCAFSVSQGGGAITQFTCTTGPVVETQFGSSIGTFRTNVLHSLKNIADDPNTPEDETAIHGRLRASFRMVANEDLVLTTDARVTSLTPDPDTTNNQQYSEVITVQAVADLALNISSTGELQPDGTTALPYDLLSGAVFPDPAFNTSNIAVTAGRRVRYTFNISNTGPSDAEMTHLTSRLPAGVIPVPGTLSVKYGNGASAPGSCQFGTPGNPADSMTCALGTIDADATSTNPAITGFNLRTVTFDVKVATDMSSGSLLINNVLLGSNILDVDNSDNLGSSLMVVSPLTGVSECTTGGPYTNVVCGNGSASIALNGFGYALPGGAVDYLWSTTCPGATFGDATSSSTQMSFTTTNPDNTPVTCSVGLEVQNSFASSNCLGIVTVVDCNVDCLGVVGGSAQLDRCGVCQGDGTSCLGCSNVDTSSNIFNMTKSAVIIRGLTINAANRLSDVKSRRSARRLAVKAFLKAIAAISKVPSAVTSCTNNTFCAQSNNLGAISSASSGISSSLATLQSVTRKMSNKSLARKLLKKGRSAASSGNVASLGVPLNSSSC